MQMGYILSSYIYSIILVLVMYASLNCIMLLREAYMTKTRIDMRETSGDCDKLCTAML